MSTPVDLDDLLHAFEWVSGAEQLAFDAEAYINRSTGEIFWVGEGIDEDLPEDIEDGCLYIAVPHKREFALGSSLVFDFVEEQMPRSYDVVRDYFHRRGAYARFKDLLA